MHVSSLWATLTRVRMYQYEVMHTQEVVTLLTEFHIAAQELVNIQNLNFLHFWKEFDWQTDLSLSAG